MRKVLLVLVILLAGVVIVGDRLGVRIAQDEIGKQVAAQYDLRQRPEVTIHGIPFLTQAIGGEYDQIDVSIAEWSERGVTVSDVKVEMKGVSAPLADVTSGNADNVTARTATASAVIPYDVIKQRAPKQVQGITAKGDNLQVDLSGSIAGIPASGTAVVSVKPGSRGITVTPISASTRGGVPIPLALLRQQLSWTVPVANLPVGSRISDIQPTPEGLRVASTAENVRLGSLKNA